MKSFTDVQNKPAMLKDTIKLHKTMIWCTFHGRLAGVTSVYMLGDTYSTKDLNSLSSPEGSATQPPTPIPGDLGCEEDNQDSRSYAQLLSHHIKKNITLIYHITLITLLKKKKKPNYLLQQNWQNQPFLSACVGVCMHA